MGRPSRPSGSGASASPLARAVASARERPPGRWAGGGVAGRRAAFAAYRRASARCSSVNGSVSCRSARAQPMVTPTCTDRPATWIGRVTAALIRAGHLLGVTLPGSAGQQHRELVAAETGDHIAGAGGFLQPAGDLDQHLVADQVSEVIVDLLEPVEVDEQQRHRMAVDCRRRSGGT